MPRDKMPQTKTTPDKMPHGKKNATGEGIALLQACAEYISSKSSGRHCLSMLALFCTSMHQRRSQEFDLSGYKC